MSMPLLQYLENPPQAAEPAKGSLPDKQEWVDFCEFELKGTRLCICDSWSPFDGVAVELPPGRYEVKALCYTYGNDVRVAALRIQKPGAPGERGELVGEFDVDVGAAGITDFDLVEALEEDDFQEWMEDYSCGDAVNQRAGRHPCPVNGTELLFMSCGFGDGYYAVHALEQDGQRVGAEARFLEENAPYPFDMERYESTPPTAEEIAVIDELIAIGKEIALSTEPIDRDACIAAFSALYEAKGLPMPEFVFCVSLMDMRNRAYPMIPPGRIFLDDIAGAQLKLFSNKAFSDAREVGIWERIWRPLECFHQMRFGEEGAEQRAGASLPSTWQLTRLMKVATWDEIQKIVTLAAAEKLGLREPDELFHLAAHALSTCGGAACYERYCFISERPSLIVHPAVTPGAPAGRCRIEWRDGFVCDAALQ